MLFAILSLILVKTTHFHQVANASYMVETGTAISASEDNCLFCAVLTVPFEEAAVLSVPYEQGLENLIYLPQLSASFVSLRLTVGLRAPPCHIC